MLSATYLKVVHSESSDDEERKLIFPAIDLIDMNRDENQNIVSIVEGKLKWWDNHYGYEGRFVKGS